MAAIRRFNAEAYTVGNAIDGSLASPDLMTCGTATGGTLTCVNANGSKAIRAGGPASALAFVSDYNTSVSYTTMAASFEVIFESIPTAAQRMMQFLRSGATPTGAPYFVAHSTGNIELWTASHTKVAGMTSVPITLGAVYEVRGLAQYGATTTSGRLKWAIYKDGVLQTSGENSATNAETTPWNGARTGRSSASSWDGYFILDNIAYQGDAPDLISARGSVPIVERNITVAQTTDFTDAITGQIRVDYAPSTNVTSLAVTSATGYPGLDASDVTVNGLVLTVPDQIGRTSDIVLAVNAIGPGGTTTDNVVIEPFGGITRRIGRLYRISGAAR